MRPRSVPTPFNYPQPRQYFTVGALRYESCDILRDGGSWPRLVSPSASPD